MAALLVTMVLALLRAFLGPGRYNRILAVNMFGTKTVLFVAVAGFLFAPFSLSVRALGAFTRLLAGEPRSDARRAAVGREPRPLPASYEQRGQQEKRPQPLGQQEQRCCDEAMLAHAPGMCCASLHST